MMLHCYHVGCSCCHSCVTACDTATRLSGWPQPGESCVLSSQSQSHMTNVLSQLCVEQAPHCQSDASVMDLSDVSHLSHRHCRSQQLLHHMLHLLVLPPLPLFISPTLALDGGQTLCWPPLACPAGAVLCPPHLLFWCCTGIPLCVAWSHINTRHRCLATVAAEEPEAVLPQLLKRAAPLLDGTNPLPCRLGGVEVMAALVATLQRLLVPYTVLLVVPLLRRMSDPVAPVRRRAALCFGALTALLPLAQGLPLPAGLDEAQRVSAEADGEFLAQLLDNKRVEDYSLPVQLKVCVWMCEGSGGLRGSTQCNGLLAIFGDRRGAVHDNVCVQVHVCMRQCMCVPLLQMGCPHGRV